MNTPDTKSRFLSGGGEMGRLIRDYNWHQTPLGDPEHWPSSLRTTLGILLNSAFPMFLFWGENNICFYNDAYRPSLGTSGKHPAIGKTGAEVWPDIWAVIGPLIDKVKATGEAVWYEDLLLSIYRNGEMQDVYWTFSYSPAYGDDGSIQGVFVTCTETTEKVQTAMKLNESEKRFKALIGDAAVGIIVLSGEDNVVELANDTYAQMIGRDVNSLMGRPLFDVIPETAPYFKKIINNVRTTGEPYYLYNHPYFVYADDNKIDGYLDLIYQPYREEDGTVKGVMVMCQDVTEQVEARQKLEQSELRFRTLVEEAVIATAIVTGPDFIVELANEALLEIWGRDRSIIGKPLLEFMPEIKDQPFPKLLANVLATGEPYFAQDALVLLKKHGRMETVYMDFSYKPLISETGEPNSILIMASDVTERVTASRRLAQSEQNLRNTILKAPAAMCILKGSDNIVEIANEKMIELWGKTAEDVVGKPLFTGLPEAKDQGFEYMLHSVLTTGKTESAQGVPVTLPRDGHIEIVYVNFVYEAYRDPDGNITGIIAVAVDVTEQVTSAKKLEESEQRLRSVVESAPFPIGVYTGREMRITTANQSIMDVWGKGNDVVGKRYIEVLPELEHSGIPEQLDSVYVTGIPYHARNQRVDLVVNDALQPFYFNYSFTPLFDADGNIYGVMNTAAEVTDLNLAKQKVEQSERNFRNIILQSPVAMCLMLGPDHTVEIANEAMINLWGKQPEEVMHKPIFEGLPDAREQGLEKMMDGVFYTGEAFTANEMPVNLIRFGVPETVYQNFVYEPYKDGDGTVLGVLAISIDVTQQVLARHKIEEVVKERTQELEQANSSLKRSNAELAQFAYIASHDLQEPLRKISTFSQMIETRAGDLLDEQSRNYFDKIKKASSRMQALIKDVLAYSELGKGADTFEEVDLNKVFTNVLADFDLLIEQKEAVISTGKLPVIEAIPLQMSQLFGNLISNSLKFAKKDVKPVISITVRNLNTEEAAGYALDPFVKYVHIRFTDNGIGFDEAYADKIFSIFQRLHGKNEYEGTGIGLAMCKKIALNHNGELNARGSSGDGAVFNVFLPLKHEETH